MRKIIGLVGSPGAGKDALAKHLIKYNFKRIAFADKIKEMYFQKANITEEHFKSIRGTEEEMIIRDNLWAQSKRYKDEDNLYFIRPVIKEAINSTSHVVITDVRTKDELIEVAKIGQLILIIKNRKLTQKIEGTELTLSDLDGVIVWNNVFPDENSVQEMDSLAKFILKE